MLIKFTTNKPFGKYSDIGPDNYYLGECDKILNKISKKKCDLREVDGGGNGGQGCGNVWTAYEYFENNTKKEIILSVTYEDIDIEIMINFENECNDENDILLCEFINILKNEFVES